MATNLRQVRHHGKAAQAFQAHCRLYIRHTGPGARGMHMEGLREPERERESGERFGRGGEKRGECCTWYICLDALAKHAHERIRTSHVQAALEGLGKSSAVACG